MAQSNFNNKGLRKCVWKGDKVLELWGEYD